MEDNITNPSNENTTEVNESAAAAEVKEEIQSIAVSHDSKNRIVELLYDSSSKKYKVIKEDHEKEFDEETEARKYFDHMVECSQAQY